jgi:glycosyltransferase involved in cell wall biosynthesis
MAPKVSICLPIFNGSDFLAAALDSALGQTFRDFELIVIDDCSTDNSFEIASQYARRDARIFLSRNESNQGLFANYNACISKAQGSLVKPFAQDDLWHPELLQKCISAFDASPDLAKIAT